MGQPGEIGTVARIVELSHQLEREIEILTVDAPDIIDLLDDGVIKRMSARAGRNSFPGHRAARDAFALTSGPRNASAYKKFLWDQYGVRTGTRAILEVARAMRRRGLPAPPQLEDVIFRVEQLALTVELR
jgi:hypothetical protein